MRRIEKLGDALLSAATFPIRFCIGAYKAVSNNMPEKIELPIEISIKKEDKNGNRKEAVSRGEG